MRAQHAQELRTLLNHIMEITHNDHSKRREERRNQFGEFSRSLVSYIEAYLTAADIAALPSSDANFIIKVIALKAQLEVGDIMSPDDHLSLDVILAEFNQKFARELKKHFPPLSSFTTAEAFNNFLDAFAKTPADAAQTAQFAELKSRAAALIAGRPGRGIARALAAGGSAFPLGSGSPATPSPADAATSAPSATSGAGAGAGAAAAPAPAPVGGTTSRPLARALFIDGEDTDDDLILGQSSPLSVVEAVTASSVGAAAAAGGATPLLDDEARFTADLQKALNLATLDSDPTAIAGDLRIEKFTDTASFNTFLELAFGREKKEALSASWGSEITNLFSSIQAERKNERNLHAQVAELDAVLPAFVSINNGAGAGTGAASLSLGKFTALAHSDLICSRYALKPAEPTIRDFIQNANGVLWRGRELRRLLISYEKQVNNLLECTRMIGELSQATDEASVAALSKQQVQQAQIKEQQAALITEFCAQAETYLSLVEAAIAVARRLALPEANFVHIQKHKKAIEDLRKVIVENTDPASTTEYFDYYSVNEILQEIESADYSDSCSLTQLFAELRKSEAAKRDAAIAKLTRPHTLSFGSSAAASALIVSEGEDESPKLEAFFTAEIFRLLDRATLFSPEELYPSTDPSLVEPISRAQHRLPIEMASSALQVFFYSPPAAAGAGASVETVKAGLMEERRLALKRALREDTDPNLLLVIYAHFLSTVVTKRESSLAIPFLPPELLSVLQKELKLTRTFTTLVQAAEPLTKEAANGQIDTTRGFLPDVILHEVSSHATEKNMAKQLGVLLHNYFRAIEAASQFQSEETQLKFLVLPILPFVEGVKKDYEIGAVVAAMAALIYRQYRLAELKIILLPPADGGVPEALIEKIERWFSKEWRSPLLRELSASFAEIDMRDHRPDEVSLVRAFTVTLGLKQLINDWFPAIETIPAGIKNGMSPETTLIAGRVNSNPLFSRVNVEAYLAYAKKNATTADRLSKLTASWNKGGAEESLYDKVLRTLKSYYTGGILKTLGLVGDKHNMPRVEAFVEEMKKAEPQWDLAELELRLLGLLRLVTDDFTEDSDYAVAEFISGSFVTRLMFILDQISKFRAAHVWEVGVAELVPAAALPSRVPTPVRAATPAPAAVAAGGAWPVSGGDSSADTGAGIGWHLLLEGRPPITGESTVGAMTPAADGMVTPADEGMRGMVTGRDDGLEPEGAIGDGSRHTLEGIAASIAAGQLRSPTVGGGDGGAHDLSATEYAAAAAAAVAAGLVSRSANAGAGSAPVIPADIRELGGSSLFRRSSSPAPAAAAAPAPAPAPGSASTVISRVSV